MQVHSEVTGTDMAAEAIWQQPLTLPPLPDDVIHIWRLRPESRLATEDYLPYLQPDERERASRLRFAADQHQFIACRATLRLLLAHYSAVKDPHELDFAYGAQGKPCLVGSHLRFNISHTRAFALFAFARGIDLGIDVEDVHLYGDLDAVAEQNFAPAERAALLPLPQPERAAAFYRCWTRKEALLKAEGSGLFRALDTFTVSFLPGAPAKVSAGPGGWGLRHIDVAPNVVGAVAWRRFDTTPAFHLMDCSQALFSARTRPPQKKEDAEAASP